MENENKQNQGGKSGEGVLQLLQPHDMSKTVESAMHVVQGRHEKLPELLHDVGTLVIKGARKLSTPQLILAAGAATIAAILLSRYAANHDFDFEEAA
ncbi:hypothetical protein [Pontibacter sp. SGAir0037]|uniref:hypothetical protein n=1 Tax=Pontibacter sp. SGAir0037 TaxID=2571030 RepID=UPI0010CD2621|nr:hypothetical protein [Pontibacter sp. SGAir0037]QCR22772.1 hypothetical protein C1N53_10745 [Pontibacter sp. SGAir0037]